MELVWITLGAWAAFAAAAILPGFLFDQVTRSCARHTHNPDPSV
jgi:hypothetical protein